jgi:hypothetical protein
MNFQHRAVVVMALASVSHFVFSAAGTVVGTVLHASATDVHFLFRYAVGSGISAVVFLGVAAVTTGRDR